MTYKMLKNEQSVDDARQEEKNYENEYTPKRINNWHVSAKRMNKITALNFNIS